MILEPTAAVGLPPGCRNVDGRIMYSAEWLNDGPTPSRPLYPLSTSSVLYHAQRLYPLDLVARLDYLHALTDRCAPDERDAVQAAIDTTRNGGET
jgi:hypothetical protein